MPRGSGGVVHLVTKLIVNQSLARFEQEVDAAIASLDAYLARLRAMRQRALETTIPASGVGLDGMPPWVTPIWTDWLGLGGGE